MSESMDHSKFAHIIDLNTDGTMSVLLPVLCFLCENEISFSNDLMYQPICMDKYGNECNLHKKRKSSETMETNEEKRLCIKNNGVNHCKQNVTNSVTIFQECFDSHPIHSILVHLKLQHKVDIIMDKDQINKLSNEELQQEMLKYVSEVPPITDFTRNVCENLLYKQFNNEQLEQNDAFKKPDCIKVLSDSVMVEPSDTYYGVCMLNALDEETGKKFVFSSRSDALEQFRKQKGARFKAFSTYDEALQFACAGNSILDVSVSVASTKDEKPCAFSSPAPQQHVKFRKVIEKGNIEEFDLFVKGNPRYLVSKADTPSILKEGPRYNGLHIACLSNQPLVCQKILDIVSSPDLFQRLYPDDSIKSSERRSKYLFDLYLNTPDKASNRTPLHHAAAYGFISCVKVLVSYPGCNKHITDKFGKTARETSCSRSSSVSPELINQIEVLLSEHFYVPLLKDENDCFSDKIGTPMSPASPTTSLLKERNSDLMSPSYKIQGYAGPMKYEQSNEFYRKLRPHIPLSPVRIPKQNGDHLLLSGRKLAKDMNITWTDYWPFLNDFVDISNEEGLTLLESHLQSQFNKIIQDQLHNVSDVESCEEKLPDSPTKNEASRVSSIALLCMELEALRLNRSMSPGKSPSIHTQNLSIHEEIFPPNNNITMSNEFSPYQYAIQSACVTGEKLATILSEFLVFTTNTVYEYSLLKNFTNKLRPEVLCLQDVLSKMPNNYRFVHPVAVTRCVERVLEHQMADDILKLLNVVKSVKSSDQVIADISDDDISTDLTHVICIINLLNDGLLIAYNNAKEASNYINWKDLCSCNCKWGGNHDSQGISSPEAAKTNDLIHRVLYGENVVRRLSFSDIDESWEEPPDDDSFVSVFSSFKDDDDESLKTPDEVIPCFLYGESPCSEDVDVYKALENIEFDEDKFPSIFEWFSQMDKCDTAQILAKKRNNGETTDKCPSFCSTPDLLRRTFKSHLISTPKK